MGKYKHLGENERYVIELMLSNGESQNQVSKLLGYSKTTISREISRNSIAGKYSSSRAQHMYLLRREYPKQDRKFNKLTDKAISLIVEYLKKRSSPYGNKLLTTRNFRS